jgi:cytoskeletal protein CcmA (bactofilin family)
VKDAQTHRVYLARACGISFALEQRMRVMSDQAGVVIKDDIKFAGQRVQIVSQSKIEIDCEFEGDVTGPEVVVSKRGRVRGIVAGERVTVLGRIVGDIRGKTIALMCKS